MSWDPYLDLEAGVLRNRLGITDSDASGRHPIRWTAMDPAANVAASRAAHLDGDTGPLRALLDSIVAR